MNDKSRPRGLSRQMPNGLPEMTDDDKRSAAIAHSKERPSQKKGVMSHAPKGVAVAQIQEINLKLKEDLTRMVNDFLADLASESKLMMDRYGSYNSEMQGIIEGAKDERKRAIGAKRNELEGELRAGISTAEKVEEELSAFISRQKAKFQRLVDLGNVATEAIGDLYEASTGRDKFYKDIDLNKSDALKSTIYNDIIFDRLIKDKLDSGRTDFQETPSAAVRAKLRIIDDFVLKNPGKPVSDMIFRTFPGLNELEENAEVGLSEERRASNFNKDRAQPPMLWADRVERMRGQNPIPFLREQYATELEGGMSIGQLKIRDAALGVAVSRWVERHGLPTDLNLDMRSRQQRNDEALMQREQAMREGRELSFSEREEKRLRAADRRRQK